MSMLYKNKKIMETIPKNPIEAQQPLVSSERSIVHEESTPPLSQLAGREVVSDLPNGINPFDDEQASSLRTTSLRPMELAKLPEGEYTVTEVLDEEDNFFDELPQKRTLVVFDTEAGKAVAEESFQFDFNLVPGTSKIMRGLGYEVAEIDGHESIVAVPTPETVKHAAEQLGVSVELYPETGYINAPEYLGTFARGAYPIAGGNESNYGHDIGDDHLTAMVLGGEPLRDVLQEVSQEALDSNNPELMKSVTADIDTFTGELRRIVSPGQQASLGEAYSEQKGYYTFLDTANKLGLSKDQVDIILTKAIATAEKFGMPVRNLAGFTPVASSEST